MHLSSVIWLGISLFFALLATGLAAFDSLSNNKQLKTMSRVMFCIFVAIGLAFVAFTIVFYLYT